MRCRRALAGGGPGLIHVRLTVDGAAVDDTFYWQNYKENPGCLKALPPAALEVREAGPGHVRIVNTGQRAGGRRAGGVSGARHRVHLRCRGVLAGCGREPYGGGQPYRRLRLSAFNVKETQW